WDHARSPPGPWPFLTSPDNPRPASPPHLGRSAAAVKPPQLQSLPLARRAALSVSPPPSAGIAHPPRSGLTTPGVGLYRPSQSPLLLSGCCQNNGSIPAPPPKPSLPPPPLPPAHALASRSLPPADCRCPLPLPSPVWGGVQRHPNLAIRQVPGSPCLLDRLLQQRLSHLVEHQLSFKL